MSVNTVSVQAKPVSVPCASTVQAGKTEVKQSKSNEFYDTASRALVAAGSVMLGCFFLQKHLDAKALKNTAQKFKDIFEKTESITKDKLHSTIAELLEKEGKDVNEVYLCSLKQMREFFKQDKAWIKTFEDANLSENTAAIFFKKGENGFDLKKIFDTKNIEFQTLKQAFVENKAYYVPVVNPGPLLDKVIFKPESLNKLGLKGMIMN